MRRLTIRKKKKYLRKEKKTLIMMFFIITPLVSIIIGQLVSNKIIVPYMNRSKMTINESLDIDTTKITSLEDFEIYNIEVNGFENINKAEEFLKKLNAEGMLGYVSKANNYKVFINITYRKRDVEIPLVYIKEKYPNSRIQYIKVEGKQFYDVESNEEYYKEMVNILNEVNSIYKEELSMWSREVSDVDYEELKTTIDQNTKKIDSEIEKQSNNLTTSQLREFYSMMKVNIDNRKKIVNEFEPEDIESVKKAYFNYIKEFFSYVNYYKI